MSWVVSLRLHLIESAFSQPASSGDDLGWLNNLGGDLCLRFLTETLSTSTSIFRGRFGLAQEFGGEKPPAFDESMAARPESPQGDLNWLNNLGDTTAPAFDEQVPVPPASPQDDLDWLKNLGNEIHTCHLMSLHLTKLLLYTHRHRFMNRRHR